ncbi:hypothetical protein, partial [Methanosalsum natronophilum]|uniref:hypothetical protein n=1 Tax=Methanosalsum natronophilum TaxID=768733 RepID=UPI0021690B47
MVFDDVIFGTYTIGIGLDIGNSIGAGGYAPYLVTLENIGSEGINAKITYYDQFGQGPKIADYYTGISAFTSAGTQIPIILNSGDTGIRSITSIEVNGGEYGDTFHVQSIQEG